MKLDLLDHRKVPSNPDEIRINCPFCSTRGKTPDTKYHLYINLKKRVYHCFRCGVKGKLKDVPELSMMGSQDRPPPFSDDAHFVPLSEARKGLMGSKAIKYLRKRGMYDLSRFYLGLSGRWYGRVVVPVKEKSTVVAWIGRAFLKGIQPKYLLSSDFKASGYLFNLFESLSQPQIFLVEGVFDALSVPGGVALLGKEMSNTQISKILTYVDEDKPIYVALDADADDEAREIARRLAVCRSGVYLVGYKNAKDMNDVLIGKGKWFIREKIS